MTADESSCLAPTATVHTAMVFAPVRSYLDAKTSRPRRDSSARKLCGCLEQMHGRSSIHFLRGRRLIIRRHIKMPAISSSDPDGLTGIRKSHSTVEALACQAAAMGTPTLC